MKPLSILWLATLALPPAALAQTYHSRDFPLAREELAGCMDRDEHLAARMAGLEAERRLNDREGAAIARESALLADDLRRLDPADPVAVAAHNARTAQHNQRVDAHNLRVADMNDAARAANRDQADLVATCGSRTYYPSDRTLILRERSTLR